MLEFRKCEQTLVSSSKPLKACLSLLKQYGLYFQCCEKLPRKLESSKTICCYLLRALLKIPSQIKRYFIKRNLTIGCSWFLQLLFMCITSKDSIIRKTGRVVSWLAPVPCSSLLELSELGPVTSKFH